MWRIYIFVSIASMITACSTGGAPMSGSRNDGSGPLLEMAVSGNEDLTIPENEISSLQEQALMGSGQAAHKLATFYLFVERDNIKGMYWETISAENGDRTGMYSLGLYLMEQTTDHESVLRARYWLGRAEKAGEPLATEVLQDMDKKGLR